jgi:hypothetical protein
LTKICWMGYSAGAHGGTANLSLSNVMLTDSPLTKIDPNGTVVTLDFSEAGSAFVNGLSTAERIFSNISLVSMQLPCGSNSSFESTEARLVPPGITAYSKVLFDEQFNLTLWLPAGSEIDFTSIIDGNLTNIAAIGGKIHVNFAPRNDFVVFINNNRVLSEGNTYFEKAFISWPYNIYDLELPMEINGSVSFKTNVMGQDFTLISELEVKGFYKVFSEQQVQWNEWNVPWSTILTSSYNILLVCTITATAVLSEAKKRHWLRIRNANLERDHDSRGH